MGRHSRPARHRTPDVAAAALILAEGWLALVGAPATYGAAQFNPGTVLAALSSHGDEPVTNAVIGGRNSATQGPPPRVVTVAAVTPRIPPIVGAAGLTPNAAALAAYIQATYPGVASIGGVRPDPLPDHPSGHAIDIMIGTDTELGNRIEADLMAQAGRFGVKYLIWRETYHTPSGAARFMANRGSPTANHMDHVHCTVW